MSNLIILDKISKSFLTNKKINVLNKINYKFNKGKIYSLVGPSGSGKSTLLNILSLIDKPSMGKLKIEGKDIIFSDSEVNDKIRAKKIGIIYQQNNLLPDFTALENVYLARLSIENNKKKAIEVAKKILSSGIRRPLLLWEGWRMASVSAPEETPWICQDVNTPDEFKKAQLFFQRKHD